MPITKTEFNLIITLLGEIMSKKAASGQPPRAEENRWIRSSISSYWHKLAALYHPKSVPAVYSEFYARYDGVYLGLSTSTVYTINLCAIQNQLNQDLNDQQVPLKYTGLYKQVDHKGCFSPKNSASEQLDHIYTEALKPPVQPKKIVLGFFIRPAPYWPNAARHHAGVTQAGISMPLVTEKHELEPEPKRLKHG
ncbi:MAG: hypothetical protein ACHP65_04835 [Legionellales bacterium]